MITWTKLIRMALLYVALPGAILAESAQAQTCPTDARAQIIALEKKVEQRALAARQTPETQFIPNQDELFNQVHALMIACPDNTTVNKKLPFMFFGLSYLAETAMHRAAIADLAYTALMRAKADMQKTIENEQEPDALRKVVADERRALMADLNDFIIPAMFDYGAVSGSGFAAFSNQETPDTCPYADGERFFVFSELEAHGKILQNTLFGMMQSGYVLTEPPLEYRLKALRKACPDHAKQITVDMAVQWTLIALAAHDAPDATLVNGEPQPADLVETASAKARELLENYELMREDPVYLDKTLSMAERALHEGNKMDRTRLANNASQTLDDIASGK